MKPLSDIDPIDTEALLLASQTHRKAAERILHTLQLVEQWQEYGTVEITGSYRWNLMLGSDIDFNVVNPAYDLELALQILNRFIRQGPFTRFAFIDTTQNKPIWADPETYPRGFYFGMAGDFEGREWKFETWLLGVPLPPQDWILEQMTEQKRGTILRLKHLRKTGMFKAGSVDIYRAVLLGDAHDPKSVEEWLAQEKTQKR